MTEQGISNKALANTYDNGGETVEQYRTATGLHQEQPDLAYTELARRVDRSPSTVRAWVVEDNRPDPVQAIETATTHGWLTADTESELFRAINSLTAWIFAGGGIGQRAFVPHFSADDLLELSTLHHLLGVADLPYRIREEGPDQAVEIVPSEGAAVFGRLLSVLGAPVGRKAEQAALTLPEYLDGAPTHLRRDFARVYLLARATPISDTGRYRIDEVRAPEYLRELQQFLRAVTGADVLLGSQDRLVTPAAALEALCEGTADRTALAAQIAHGSDSPPTERAVAAAYRREESPSGRRYIEAYRAATSDDGGDIAAIADEYGLSQVTVYNWQQGTTPKLVTAVETIRDRDWIAPTAPEPAESLTALVAWLGAFGSLEQTFHPVFRVRTQVQRDWIQTLTDQLGLSLSSRFEDDRRTTELRVSPDANRLGRVLHAVGVLTTGRDTDHLPPPYLWHDTAAARVYATTWVLIHGELRDGALYIGTAYGASEWVLRTVGALVQDQLDWTVEAHTEHELRVAYESVRPTLIDVLTPRLTTKFERSHADTA